MPLAGDELEPAPVCAAQGPGGVAHPEKLTDRRPLCPRCVQLEIDALDLRATTGKQLSEQLDGLDLHVDGATRGELCFATRQEGRQARPRAAKGEQRPNVNEEHAMVPDEVDDGQL